MTGHCEMPINPVCFSHVWIEPTMEQRVLRWRKNLIVLPYRWYDGMDVETIEIIGNRRLESTDQGSCSFWPAEALEKHWC